MRNATRLVVLAATTILSLLVLLTVQRIEAQTYYANFYCQLYGDGYNNCPKNDGDCCSRGYYCAKAATLASGICQGPSTKKCAYTHPNCG